jgi:hypothetical protein
MRIWRALGCGIGIWTCELETRDLDGVLLVAQRPGPIYHVSRFSQNDTNISIARSPLSFQFKLGGITTPLNASDPHPPAIAYIYPIPRRLWRSLPLTVTWVNLHKVKT